MKIITKLIVLLFFIAIAGATYGQEFSPDSRMMIDSLKAEIEMQQKRLEVIAGEIADMAHKISQESATESERRLYREYEEEYRELSQEIIELKQELNEGEYEMKAEDLEKPSEDLTIKIKRSKSSLSEVKTRWGLVDLGFATFSFPNDLPEIEGVNPMEPDLMSSISWRLHIMNQRINLSRHKTNLIYGFGLEFDSYGLSYPVTLQPSSPLVEFSLPEENKLSFKKNKLRVTYLHIPVMLNFETNPSKKSKSYHFNAGVYGNVLLKAKTVQKTNEYKSKVKDQFNLNNFQYGLLAQAGYGPITFYGTYGLNEFFKPEKDNGYTLIPITFGIKIIPF